VEDYNPDPLSYTTNTVYFNFPLSFPSSTTITGFEVVIAAFFSNFDNEYFNTTVSGTYQDLVCQLSVNGVQVGVNKATQVTTDWEVPVLESGVISLITYGSPSDLWGAPLTAEAFNDNLVSLNYQVAVEISNHDPENFLNVNPIINSNSAIYFFDEDSCYGPQRP